MERLLRNPVTWVLVGVLVLGGSAFGLYWFTPWKLFTSTQVNEEVPTVAAPAPPGQREQSGRRGNQLLAEGTLISHEHETSGTVQLIELADGRRQLVLKDLSTSDGPDLRVWLTDRPVVDGAAGWRVFDDGEYIEVGKLKGNKGNQVYALPSDLDLDAYRSLTIWCKRFAISFGAAELNPA